MEEESFVARKLTFTRQLCQISARAVTYCDVMSLRMTVLLSILERDVVMQRALLKRAGRAHDLKAKRSSSPSVCAARWIGKLRGRAAGKAAAAAGLTSSRSPSFRRPPLRPPPSRVVPSVEACGPSPEKAGEDEM